MLVSTFDTSIHIDTTLADINKLNSNSYFDSTHRSAGRGTAGVQRHKTQEVPSVPGHLAQVQEAAGSPQLPPGAGPRDLLCPDGVTHLLPVLVPPRHRHAATTRERDVTARGRGRGRVT